ncbi:MAG: imidazolonepropionase [Phycisphaeraceae bacterium]|nr:imidazolonepropionase [Phycisphaeraceae bacterium]
MKIVIRNARVVTTDGSDPAARRGGEMSGLRVLPCARVWIKDGLIDSIDADPGEDSPEDWRDLDAAGRVVMPAFIDCHTHACFAGDRLDEWEMKRRGAAYLDILRAGGGIMSTVRAVRAASQEQLAELLLVRLTAMLNHGTGTAEVKSGYGLTTGDELKMLRAIRDAGALWPGTVVPTALLGHAIDPDQPDFVDRTIRETLPAVSAEFPGITIDAFCEAGAWTLADTLRLFERALELGHPLRVHADQFNSLGLIGHAARLGLRSIDHLEASDARALTELAASGAAGVVLPCCGLHVDGRYADARSLIDRGGAVAVATNFNPGSAPCYAVPMAVALAVRFNRLTPAEAITATTANAAAILDFTDRGRLEAGLRADIIMLRHRDERLLAHDFGDNPVDAVIVGGRIIRHA